jgi:hypothetical protein
MNTLSRPLHGIRRTLDGGWEVWSFTLQFPVACGSPVDAKRIASALALAFPLGGPVDYGEVEAAIAVGKAPTSVAQLQLS